jgi:ABC-type phosphate/phosphonate transport system permease subunit
MTSDTIETIIAGTFLAAFVALIVGGSLSVRSCVVKQAQVECFSKIQREECFK